MSTLALLPNLAGGDGLLILLIVLLLFGAKKLPELAKGLGSAVREFSKAKDEIEHDLTRPPTPAQPRIELPAINEFCNEVDPHTPVVLEEVQDAMISTPG
jgi:sec-independent protein translocase protein TatA